MTTTSYSDPLSYKWQISTYSRYKLRTSANWTVNNNSYTTFNPGTGKKAGVRDTDWKVKISRGENAAHPYELSRFHGQKASILRASTMYDQNNAGRWADAEAYVRTLWGTGFIQPNSHVELRDRALARFQYKLRENIGNVEALVPLVELRELGKTTRGLANLSMDFVLNLALIRKTRGRSMFNFFQKEWLAYSFGIAPLIGDTLSIIDAINSYQQRTSSTKRIRSSALKGWTSSAKRTLLYNNALALKVDESISLDHSVRYTFDSAVDFSFYMGNNYGVGEHLGLSDLGKQLPSVGWELLPFSWVFDYFTTMGAYLGDTIEIPSGFSKYLTQTQTYKCRATIFPDAELYGPYYKKQFTDKHIEQGKWEYIYVKRDVLANLPHRTLRFKTQDEIGANAVRKLLNLTALLSPSRRGFMLK